MILMLNSFRGNIAALLLIQYKILYKNSQMWEAFMLNHHVKTKREKYEILTIIIAIIIIIVNDMINRGSLEN